MEEKTLMLIKQTTAEFSRKTLRPNRSVHDHFPPPDTFINVIEEAYAMDLFHLTLPESMGGMGLNMASLITTLINICEEDTSLGAIIFTHIAAQELILAAQAANLLPDPHEQHHITGTLMAFPIYHNLLDTPPTLKATTPAKAEADAYRLSGNIDYLVMGHMLRHAVVPALMSDTGLPSYFLVDLGAAGATVSEPVLSLGLHACGAVDVELHEAAGRLVGKPGEGGGYFESMAAKMAAAAAAMSLGIMQGAFKEALAYARERSQGGRKIIDWSELKMMLANMAVEIRTAEMMMDQAGLLSDARQQTHAQYARAVQIAVQESACKVTTDGVQVLGGAGYMKDFGQEKRYRDAHQLQSIFGHAPMKKLKLIETIINPGSG